MRLPSINLINILRGNLILYQMSPHSVILIAKCQTMEEKMRKVLWVIFFLLALLLLTPCGTARAQGQKQLDLNTVARPPIRPILPNYSSVAAKRFEQNIAASQQESSSTIRIRVAPMPLPPGSRIGNPRGRLIFYPFRIPLIVKSFREGDVTTAVRQLRR